MMTYNGLYKNKELFCPGRGLQMEVISPAVQRGWEDFASPSLLPGLTNWQRVSGRGVENPKPSLCLFWWGMRVQEGCFRHRVLLLGCSPGAMGSAGVACSQGEKKVRTSLP